MTRFITWACVVMVPIGLMAFTLAGDWPLGIICAVAYLFGYLLGRDLTASRRSLERSAERLAEMERRTADGPPGGGS